MNIKGETEKLISQYNTSNPLIIAEEKEIVVISMPLGKVKGAYKYLNRNKVIFLNSDLDEHEKFVVCAHELGHALLHERTNCAFLKNYTLYSTDKIEKQANLFCSYLLIPDSSLELYKDYSVNQIAAIFNVPVEYLYMRMH